MWENSLNKIKTLCSTCSENMVLKI